MFKWVSLYLVQGTDALEVPGSLQAIAICWVDFVGKKVQNLDFWRVIIS